MSSERILLASVLVLLLAAPSAAPRAQQAGVSPAATPATAVPGDVLFFPDDPVLVDPDRTLIEMPREREASEFVDAVSKSVSRPDDHEDPGSGYALNINTMGEVPDSSWFTNRHGRQRMGLDEIEQGPDTQGPPGDGVWRIVGTVGQGQTEKFMMEDPDGRRFIVKLDSDSHPELMSASEVICTKFFHSLGYNVPENYIVTFSPEQLVIEEDAYPEHDLRERLEDAPRTPDGRVRAVASLLLQGEPLGPFSYQGTRPDDPNDVFPHQHRRELRALKVFAAWLNHTDVKSANSLDVFLEHEEGGWVEHHLIDFGSCLGSAASGAKDIVTGWEYYLEPAMALKGMLGLGLWVRPYVAIDYPDHPAVGHIEADLFQPWLWKPPIPHPAFRMMDAADAFWGARIVARYVEHEIRALVGEGRMTDPEAESHLIDVLLRRRDKTVAYWLTRTNPLDRFEASSRDDGRLLRFSNAALREELVTGEMRYRYRWFRLDNETGERVAVAPEAAMTPGPDQRPTIPVPDDTWGPVDPFGLRYATVEVLSVHPSYPHWDRPVTVTLRRGSDGAVEVVGLRRPREMPPPPPAG